MRRLIRGFGLIALCAIVVIAFFGWLAGCLATVVLGVEFIYYESDWSIGLPLILAAVVVFATPIAYSIGDL